MALLTDADFRTAVDRDIVIEPFDERCLSTIGYDCRVGEFVYSLEHGLLTPTEGIYSIPAGATVQILTREALWVSSRIAGTLHSRVALVSRGFSHISTTLDPGWYGPLLVTLHNQTHDSLNLSMDSSFVTVLFHRVRTPSVTAHKRFGFIQRLLVEQSSRLATDQYVAKVAQLLDGNEATADFRNRVEYANARALVRVVRALRRLQWDSIRRKAIVGAIWTGIAVLSGLSLYWERVRLLLGGIEYDSKIAAAQIAAIVALFAMLLSLRKSS